MRWSRRELLAGGALVASRSFGLPALARDRTLGPFTLSEAFTEDFAGPLSLWNPKTHEGRWKQTCFYGDPFGPSGRISNDEIAVDEAYCGINPFIRDSGVFRLELARTTSADPRLGGKKLTTGLLTTERSFVQTYGYFECRFASPGVPGCWPSFWLYSAPEPDLTGTQWDNGLGYGRQWTGGLNNEVDVVEILTNNTMQTNHTASARRAWLDGKAGTGFDPTFVPKVAGTRVAPSAGTTTPRTYGVLWTRPEIVWYVDDVEVFRTPNPGIHDPMYMIVSMGAGGWNGNAIAPDFTSAQMIVDHVKAFSLVS
jgi:hypothetical protein